MLLNDLLNKLASQIKLLTDEKEMIEKTYRERGKRGCFTRFWLPVKTFFHNESQIKADKLEALKDVYKKLQAGYFKKEDFQSYLNRTYVGDPRIPKSKAFAGLSNRTEALLDEVRIYLNQQQLVEKAGQNVPAVRHDL